MPDGAGEAAVIDVQDRGLAVLPVVLAPRALGRLRAHRIVRRVLAVAAVDVHVVPLVDVRYGPGVVDGVLDGELAVGEDRRGEADPAPGALDLVRAQLVRRGGGARGSFRPGARAGATAGVLFAPVVAAVLRVRDAAGDEQP